MKIAAIIFKPPDRIDSRELPIIDATISVMAITARKFAEYSNLLAARGNTRFATKANPSGSKMMIAVSRVIARASTGTRAPISQAESAGVSTAAAIVETAVIVTESGTSALARKAITLDAVPPGQQATRISPAPISAGSANAITIAYPNAGMTVYCKINPAATCPGFFRTRLKSAVVRLSPVKNIMSARAILM